MSAEFFFTYRLYRSGKTVRIGKGHVHTRVRTARDRVLDVEAEASQDRRRGCSVSSEPAALAGAAEAER
jgi:hypothetical protein